jgi:hypothetical protein
MAVAGLLEIVGLLTVALKSLPLVIEFLRTLQATPAEKQADLLSAIRAASTKADATKGDTSSYEDLLKGR